MDSRNPEGLMPHIYAPGEILNAETTDLQLSSCKECEARGGQSTTAPFDRREFVTRSAIAAVGALLTTACGGGSTATGPGGGSGSFGTRARFGRRYRSRRFRTGYASSRCANERDYVLRVLPDLSAFRMHRRHRHGKFCLPVPRSSLRRQRQMDRRPADEQSQRTQRQLRLDIRHADDNSVTNSDSSS